MLYGSVRLHNTLLKKGLIICLLLLIRSQYGAANRDRLPCDEVVPLPSNYSEQLVVCKPVSFEGLNPFFF